MKLSKTILALLLALSIVPISAQAKAANTDYSNMTASEIVSNLTLKQKVEQMIMPCIRRWKQAGETEETRFTEMNDEARAFIAAHNFAGICLFEANITGTEQITRLDYDIQQAASSGNNLPYLLSVDQEGGRVVRLNSGTAFSGNMSLAATTDTQNAYTCANILGSEMLSCGMNIDFAPDVDVNVNPSNPVINTRSFSDSASMVAQFGSAYVAGLNDANVASTIKHFPGHGDTATDSHSGLPLVSKSKAELDECELAAFKQVLASQDVDCVMTAHIQFPQVETTQVVSKSTGDKIYLPATLSKTFLTDILRTEMGFDGVVCTDALEMQAIKEHFGLIDAAVLGINAGVDILLMPFDVKSASLAADMNNYVEEIVAKVKAGEISETRIDESCARVVQMKLDRKIIGGSDTRTIEERLADALANVNCSAHQNAESTIADKSITVVKNENNALPLKTEGQKILVMYVQPNSITTIQEAVKKLVASGAISSSTTFEYVSYENGTQTVADEVAAKIAGCDQVLCFTALSGPDDLNPVKSTENNNPTLTSDEVESPEPGLNATQYAETYRTSSTTSTNSAEVSESGVVDQAIAAAHSSGKKFVQISTFQPYDVARYSGADAVVATYNCGVLLMDSMTKEKSSKGPSYKAALNIVTGAVAPSGKLPVNIPKINADYTYSTTEFAYNRGFGITNLNPTPTPEPVPGGEDAVITSTASTSDSALLMCMLFCICGVCGAGVMWISKRKTA